MPEAQQPVGLAESVRDPVSKNQHGKPAVVADTFNSTTRVAEAGGSP